MEFFINSFQLWCPNAPLVSTVQKTFSHPRKALNISFLKWGREFLSSNNWLRYSNFSTSTKILRFSKMPKCKMTINFQNLHRHTKTPPRTSLTLWNLFSRSKLVSGSFGAKSKFFLENSSAALFNMPLNLTQHCQHFIDRNINSIE